MQIMMQYGKKESCTDKKRNISMLLLLILHSFDWLEAVHLELLQAILFIAV